MEAVALLSPFQRAVGSCMPLYLLLLLRAALDAAGSFSVQEGQFRILQLRKDTYGLFLREQKSTLRAVGKGWKSARKIFTALETLLSIPTIVFSLGVWEKEKRIQEGGHLWGKDLLFSRNSNSKGDGCFWRREVSEGNSLKCPWDTLRGDIWSEKVQYHTVLDSAPCYPHDCIPSKPCHFWALCEWLNLPEPRLSSKKLGSSGEDSELWPWEDLGAGPEPAT